MYTNTNMYTLICRQDQVYVYQPSHYPILPQVTILVKQSVILSIFQYEELLSNINYLRLQLAITTILYIQLNLNKRDENTKSWTDIKIRYLLLLVYKCLFQTCFPDKTFNYATLYVPLLICILVQIFWRSPDCRRSERSLLFFRLRIVF